MIVKLSDLAARAIWECLRAAKIDGTKAARISGEMWKQIRSKKMLVESTNEQGKETFSFHGGELELSMDAVKHVTDGMDVLFAGGVRGEFGEAFLDLMNALPARKPVKIK